MVSRDLKTLFNINQILSPLDRQFARDFDFAGEAHDYWEIVYVKEGEIEVVENQNVYLLKEGDMIFHAPLEFHRIKSANNSSPKIINLSFKSEGEVPQNLSSGIFCLEDSDREKFLEIFSMASLFVQSSDEMNPGFELSLKLALFIVNICKYNSISPPRSRTVTATAYEKLIETMNAELCNSLSLSALAKKNYMSTSYVKTLFKKYAGISPMTYYIRLKIAYISKLILEGMSVKEIAEKMNFSSPNYLSMFFKKYTGFTPTEHKKAGGTAHIRF